MKGVMKVWIPLHLIVLAAVFVTLWVQSGQTFDAAIDAWILALIGLAGGALGGATGFGGGAVYLPVLSARDLFADEVLATSFAIQCFGLSIAALAWAYTVFVKDGLAWDEKIPAPTLATLTFGPAVTAVPALLLTQAFAGFDADQLIDAYWIAGLAAGILVLIFAVVLWQRLELAGKLFIYPGEVWVLLLIGAAGGVVTAFFTVGIGAILALYLILRKFPAKIAIAVAVWVSTACVIAGVWSGYADGDVRADIALVAIPGAIVGGVLGKLIASYVGALWLFALAGIWLIASCGYLLSL